jgi:hypothetical protein
MTHLFPILKFLTLVLLFSISIQCCAETLLSVDFNADEGGFEYTDDAFLATSQPNYAFGARDATGGYLGTGAIKVVLGGVNSNVINGMSGGWNRSFTLAVPADGIRISLRYKLTISQSYKFDEFSRVFVEVDGVGFGRGTKTYVDHIGGSIPFSGAEPYAPSTDWQQHEFYLGSLAAGTHTIKFGGYNNKKSSISESTMIFDDLLVTDSNLAPVASSAKMLVGRLALDRFKANIQTIASFGDRCRDCSNLTSFANAQTWVANELNSLGYTVHYHNSSSLGVPVSNLYVTKIGRSMPQQMYIVSAHLDGIGGGGAADDDALELL